MSVQGNQLESSLPLTSSSSPVIILLLSFGEIEKIVWRIDLF
ncbi:MAG: hypothetical protein ACLR8P_04165 [Clostridium fessum]